MHPYRHANSTGQPLTTLTRLHPRHCPWPWLLIAVVLLVVSVADAHPGPHHDVERLTAALARTPEDPDLLIQRAVAYRLDGNLPAALADLNRAGRIAPNHKHLSLQRGLTLSALRRDAEAEAELTRCIAAPDAPADAWLERARIYHRTARSEAAIADYGEALSRRADPESYLLRGRLQESLGHLADAAAGYREGLSRLGGAVVLRLELIRVEAARARFTEAVALIDEELPRVANKADWLLRRAELEAAAGRPDRARRDRARALDEADRALRQRPTTLRLHARAAALHALGRDAEALRALRTALKKAPRFTPAVELLRQIEHAPRALTERHDGTP